MSAQGQAGCCVRNRLDRAGWEQGHQLGDQDKLHVIMAKGSQPHGRISSQFQQSKIGGKSYPLKGTGKEEASWGSSGILEDDKELVFRNLPDANITHYYVPGCLLGTERLSL